MQVPPSPSLPISHTFKSVWFCVDAQVNIHFERDLNLGTSTANCGYEDLIACHAADAVVWHLMLTSMPTRPGACCLYTPGRQPVKLVGLERPWDKWQKRFQLLERPQYWLTGATSISFTCQRRRSPLRTRGTLLIVRETRSLVL